MIFHTQSYSLYRYLSQVVVMGGGARSPPPPLPLFINTSLSPLIFLPRFTFTFAFVISKIFLQNLFVYWASHIISDYRQALKPKYAHNTQNKLAFYACKFFYSALYNFLKWFNLFKSSDLSRKSQIRAIHDLIWCGTPCIWKNSFHDACLMLKFEYVNTNCSTDIKYMIVI